MSVTYKIVRYYQRTTERARVRATGLTLEDAREHCNAPESSSRTATSDDALAHTEAHGPWFDGYTEE